MFHPRRVLQDLVDGELSDRRRIAVERHVSRCTSCAETVSQLRNLKSTLLGLRLPVPYPALRSKLLAADFQRREPGAVAWGHAVGTPTSAGTSHGGARSVARPVSGTASGRGRRRPLVAAAGGSAIVASLVLAGAYVVGSGSGPAPAEVAGGDLALRAGWDSVVPRTPTMLDTEQLQSLRAGGWYCPELESLGFTLTSAEGRTVAGRPTLELVLQNDGETVTVFEQRKVTGMGGPDGSPIDAVTGETVTTAGFDHVGGTNRDVWVRSGEPWQVVLDSPSVTYTVVSTLPAAAMPATLSQLVTTEHAQLSLAPRTDDYSMMDRIIRGLSLMTHPEELPE